MNNPPIYLCLVLHNHQPVGNFDNVFEAAYQDSYLPFLELFESFPGIQISLHTSGPLMMWLQQNHPEYLVRLAQLVDAGRIEIIGGAFYEPILPMIPQRDRVGQISRFSHWLNNHLSSDIKGMWIPERVWESQLVSSLSDAGIAYTVLDDFHFRRAGLNDSELNGYFVVEDEGKIVRIFPGSEKLRYLIPFADPQDTVEYCRQQAQLRPNSVLVFGDDGEKFGTWPDTKLHVYENGWLRKFFQALLDNRDWLKTSTLQQAVRETEPRGKIYLPDASYREMIEWALPVNRQRDYDQLVHQFEHDARWDQLKPFLSGGFWRNFKVKYPETNQMYARMMYVSRLLQQAYAAGIPTPVLDRAEDHLYQGQCNCPYWHGAFGGVYLPHLRNAIYHHLLTAENLLETALRGTDSWVEATGEDYDFDGRQEVRLANEKLVAWLSGAQGGQLYELDIRGIAHNLNASIQRRDELYHDKVKAGEITGNQAAASIHDRVVFKQAGLDQRLFYDQRLRNSLIEHFRDDRANAQSIQQGEARELGDFADASFQTTLRRNPDRVQVMFECQGKVAGHPVKMTKGVSLNAGSDVLEIAYKLENLPVDQPLLFGVEFNFAGLPDGQDDRFFSDESGNRLGQLQTLLNLEQTHFLRISDEWLKVKVELELETGGKLFTYPVQTVSQSESGFELVHQAVAVETQWQVRGDAQGRWSTVLRLGICSPTPQAPTSDHQAAHHFSKTCVGSDDLRIDP
jgi:hypothetical protein